MGGGDTEKDYTQWVGATVCDSVYETKSGFRTQPKTERHQARLSRIKTLGKFGRGRKTCMIAWCWWIARAKDRTKGLSHVFWEIHRVLTTHVVEWLSWAFASEERRGKKEKRWSVHCNALRVVGCCANLWHTCTLYNTWPRSCERNVQDVLCHTPLSIHHPCPDNHFYVFVHIQVCL